MIVLYITFSVTLPFFPSIFMDPLPQTSPITSQLCHLPETLPIVSPALEWGMVRALIPLRLSLREPIYQDFNGSNSGSLGNWYLQNCKECQLPIWPSPCWPHLTMGRSMSIPCYAFYIFSDVAHTILDTCRNPQKSAG